VQKNYCYILFTTDKSGNDFPPVGGAPLIPMRERKGLPARDGKSISTGKVYNGE
jgi:hypothetical protein